MANDPTLYDLFDATSLQNCERLLQSGEIPTADLLAGIIAADPGGPRPRWFDELVVKALRGELKQKPGRRKQSFFEQCRFAAATYDYRRLLAKMPKRAKASGAGGKPASLRGRPSLSEPRHERAAKIAIKKWRLHLDWRAFLNRISSDK
jgi:hypothetical protein